MSKSKQQKSVLGKIGELASKAFLVQEPEITTSNTDTNIDTQPTHPISMEQSEVINTVLNSTNIPDKDSRYEVQIRQAIRDADQPGPDYLEFSESVKNLISHGMSMDDAIQNSFLVLKGMGLTQEIIVSSAKHYLTVLEKESKNFEDAVLNGSREKVELPQKDVEKILIDNEGIKKQIQELQTKLDANNNIVSQKRQEITQAQTKLEINKRKFQNTVNFIKTEIENISTKVKNKML